MTSAAGFDWKIDAANTMTGALGCFTHRLTFSTSVSWRKQFTKVANIEVVHLFGKRLQVGSGSLSGVKFPGWRYLCPIASVSVFVNNLPGGVGGALRMFTPISVPHVYRIGKD